VLQGPSQTDKCLMLQVWWCCVIGLTDCCQPAASSQQLASPLHRHTDTITCLHYVFFNSHDIEFPQKEEKEDCTPEEEQEVIVLLTKQYKKCAATWGSLVKQWASCRNMYWCLLVVSLLIQSTGPRKHKSHLTWAGCMIIWHNLLPENTVYMRICAEAALRNECGASSLISPKSIT